MGIEGASAWETGAVVAVARMGAPGCRDGHSPFRTWQGTGMLIPWPQSASVAGKVITGREFKLETKSDMLEDVRGPSSYNKQNCEHAQVFNNRKTV